MSELASLLRSVAHTRPRQLAARLAKLARHAIHDHVARAPVGKVAEMCNLRRRRTSPGLGDGGLVPAGAAPRPVFAPRRERVIDPSAPRIRVLARSHSLAAPIEWRPSGWNELLWMNLHYMEFAEALDDAHFARAALDWIQHNPVDARGSWRIGWNSYVVSLRVVVWMQQLALRRERLPRGVVESLHASLAAQVRFLERNLELDIGGNHAIKNAKALVWAGRYFEGDDARRWTASGERMLARELDEQIPADGMHYERSPAYHAQVFADLLECASVLRDGALRAAVLAKLDPMAQVVADTTHPDGLPSLFNDGGLHMTYSASECLAHYRQLAGKSPQARGVFALEQTGYFGARDGDDFVLADCGAIAPDHLPAHGHGDLLAFEWTVAGRRLIVDAGVFEYERGPWRDRARATSSHNTVTLDDRDQCEFWAAFRVGRRARAWVHRFEPRERGFVLEGSHDGFAHLAGSPRHARKLTAAAGAIEVEDRIEGGAGQAVRARLLLHPDVNVHRDGAALRIESGAVVVALECEHEVELAHAWWWPDFGVCLPTRQIVITYAPAPCRGSFRLARVGARSMEREPCSLVERAAARAQVLP